MSSISNISGSNNFAMPYSVQPPSGGVTDNHQAPSPVEVTQALKRINGIFRQSNQSTYAAVEKDPASGLDVVKFIDQNTKQTINQFPSKVIVAVAQQLQQAFNSRGQMVNINV